MAVRLDPWQNIIGVQWRTARPWLVLAQGGNSAVYASATFLLGGTWSNSGPSSNDVRTSNTLTGFVIRQGRSNVGASGDGPDGLYRWVFRNPAAADGLGVDVVNMGFQYAYTFASSAEEDTGDFSGSIVLMVYTSNTALTIFDVTPVTDGFGNVEGFEYTGESISETDITVTFNHQKSDPHIKDGPVRRTRVCIPFNVTTGELGTLYFEDPNAS
jgi:hypothetical protein